MTVATIGADAILHHAGQRYRAAIGHGGIRHDKQEGDGATPLAWLPLHRVLFRADRLKRPRAAVPIGLLAPSDGWCDDPADAAYNRPVILPYLASAERMWRDDGLYDRVVVLGHNDDPPTPGLGSAIFLHLARPDRTPTEGCVALSRDDLEAVLRDAVPGSTLEITAG